MSLGYWSSLDLIAVHFGRMKAILENEKQASRAVRFGSEGFLDDLAEAARCCGLTWNEADALRVFDRACVHHEPATVIHEAQMLYEELGGQRPPLGQAERNGWLLARRSKVRGPGAASRIAQAKRGPAAAPRPSSSFPRPSSSFPRPSSSFPRPSSSFPDPAAAFQARLGCPVCAHFVHYTSRRNRVPPRRGFRVEVQ